LLLLLRFSFLSPQTIIIRGDGEVQHSVLQQTPRHQESVRKGNVKDSTSTDNPIQIFVFRPHLPLSLSYRRRPLSLSLFYFFYFSLNVRSAHPDFSAPPTYVFLLPSPSLPILSSLFSGLRLDHWPRRPQLRHRRGGTNHGDGKPGIQTAAGEKN